ncbi:MULTISPECIES: transposase [Gammaproteobacteria]|uniref:IS66 family transposase n=1 Tax=Gammaproteobacteria TaxID=1236 RepID=UPI001ADB7C36|nr:transposase [Salinisphaera sp. G21_0]MBO9494789.1 transposase [Thalassotalea sp. G20_0]
MAGQAAPKIPPKSLPGKALTCAQNQWKYLVRYLDSGLLDIDNYADTGGRCQC